MVDYMKCLTCEKITNNKKFCSNSCSKIGTNNPMWKNGRIKATKGYIKVLSRGHPFADNMGYVMEHRLVVEKKIGRYLTKDEDVHHINGIKDDNRIENLDIFSHSYHSKIERMKGNPNRWSINYDFCLECKNDKRKHEGLGLCLACYKRYRYKMKIQQEY